MQDFDSLLDDLVATLQDIPALVALVSSPSGIYAYHHQYRSDTNQYEAINRVKPGEIMVAWTATNITNRSNGIEHSFSAYLRPTGSIGQIFQAMRDGVVTTGGQKMKLTQVVQACHPPDFRGCSIRSIFITDQVSIDYHEITISLTERGADI